jgi:hypothetical protein
MRETTLFCQHIDGRHGKWYAHFYSHPTAVKMCGNEPVIQATVRELPEAKPDCYWAFWNAKDQSFHHVYPVRELVDICFPYGIKGAEELGEGVCLPVQIEEVKP